MNNENLFDSVNTCWTQPPLISLHHQPVSTLLLLYYVNTRCQYLLYSTNTCCTLQSSNTRCTPSPLVELCQHLLLSVNTHYTSLTPIVLRQHPLYSVTNRRTLSTFFVHRQHLLRFDTHCTYSTIKHPLYSANARCTRDHTCNLSIFVVLNQHLHYTS